MSSYSSSSEFKTKLRNLINTLNESNSREEATNKTYKPYNQKPNESFIAFRTNMINRYKNTIKTHNTKQYSKSPNKIKVNSNHSFGNLYDAHMTEGNGAIANGYLNSLSNTKNMPGGNSNSSFIFNKSTMIRTRNRSRIQKQLADIKTEVSCISKAKKLSIINKPILTLNNNPILQSGAVKANYLSITPTNHYISQKNLNPGLNINIIKGRGEGDYLTMKQDKVKRIASGSNILIPRSNYKMLIGLMDKDNETEVDLFKKNLW